MKNICTILSIVLFCMMTFCVSPLFCQNKTEKDNKKPKTQQADSTKVEKEKNTKIKDAAKELGEDLKEDLKDGFKQTGEDLKEQGKEIWDNLKEQSKEWKEDASDFFNTQIKANVVGKFSDSRRQANQDFCIYLLKPFKAFSITQYETFYPPIDKKTSADSSNLAISNQIEIAGIRELHPLEDLPAPASYEGELVQSSAITVNLYGASVKLDLEPRLSSYGIGNPTEKNISAFWQKLSESRFDIPLYQLHLASQKYKLNDWAYYQLVCAAATKVYPKNKNGEQALWTVFMLNQAGYAAKIGRMNLNDKEYKLIVLLPINEKLYNTSVIEIGGVPFYFFEKLSSKQKPRSIYTYEGLFSMGAYPLSLQINKPLQLPHLYERNDSFTYDVQLLNFYKSYPLCPTAVYLHSGYGDVLKKSIDFKIGPVVDSILSSASGNAGLSNALVYLTNFVSDYFKSETKKGMGSTNKAVFMDESFAYKYGNSTDKAVLLSNLISRFLKIPTVLVEYKDFALVGLAMDIPKSNDKYFVVVDNQEYFLVNPSSTKENIWSFPNFLKANKPLVVK